MIKDYADSATRQFAERGKSSFSGLDARKAQLRLQMLDAAGALDQIPPLASIGLHKLGGDRKGQWAMKISGPWRLCFRFEAGHAYAVEIVDYH